MDEAAISSFIDKHIDSSQSILLSKLDNLMSDNSFQRQIKENNRLLNDAQVAKIEQITGSDRYKFNKKGNEEQFKVNGKIQQKIMEADALLKEDTLLCEMQRLKYKKRYLKQRQKLIKLADSSQLGWLTAEEYSLNAISEDSDDEKKIQRAENAALRKFKAKTREFNWRGNRTQPYSFDAGSSTTRNSNATSTHFSNMNKGFFGAWALAVWIAKRCRERVIAMKR
ncbi:LOW QUALITY PROTEIN: hypothetical protein KUTeg_003051 [Tegillarca granosa]|uniref:Uncharacterized protein n=1 Tax=Tegillarca granosa TaxID=220873 RepID=A0ABQ9FKZ8_TEGGR|nr:LOW QUALITY PROTEIN: hypothetical protein KUTeg_003051 [Tegillarca granosa]